MNTNNTNFTYLIHGELAYKIMGAAMEVHNKLGSGFLEKVYENALIHVLRRDGIHAEQQVPIKVKFDGVIVGDYVSDIVVENTVLLELKTVSEITDIHRAQVMNYLRATGFRLGLILNFARPRLEHQRIVL